MTMPLYRFRARDGQDHLVEAHRLRMDESFAYAEICCIGETPPWVAVLRLPLAELVGLQRRLDGPDGQVWLEQLAVTPSGLRRLPE
jgi:hypothetical protein